MCDLQYRATRRDVVIVSFPLYVIHTTTHAYSCTTLPSLSRNISFLLTVAVYEPLTLTPSFTVVRSCPPDLKVAMKLGHAELT